MFFIYQILILIIILLSPIVIITRLFKNKEHKKRFVEKFCLLKKKREKGNLIWIHAASVGELMSTIPLIYEIEKNKKINTILVTTSTLSSSKIFNNYKFKKVIHQFFPIDFFYFTNKFIKYWNPNIAIFIDSEIWPCMFKELKSNSIPLLLMNARITPKSFKRWNFFNHFSKNIFHNIDYAFPQNLETEKFLKKLKVKKVNKIGNLKFCETKKQKIISLEKKFLSSVNRRLIFCASSTHPGEENEIAKSHLILRKKYKNLLTIIIPRHVDRVKYIKSDLNELNLTVHSHEDIGKIKRETDIYLVNTYGKTKSFYNHCKNVFLGGSLISHGGQNPLEAAQFGCNVLHGPNVFNFSEIYKFLQKNNIAKKVTNQSDMVSELDKLFGKKNPSKKIQKKLNSIGDKILKNSYYELGKLLKK